MEVMTHTKKALLLRSNGTPVHEYNTVPQLIQKIALWHQDDIGDIMVVLINIAVRNGLSIEHCLEVAYHDIKDRKGTMVDGVFIKEDLR